MAQLAAALVDATEYISGVTGALVPVSNTGCDRGIARGTRGRGRGRAPVGGLRRPRQRAPASSRCSSGSARSRVAGSSPASIWPCWWTSSSIATLPPDAAARAAAGRRQGDPDALMPIVLCRVDDRLIHGQVVMGWGRPLAVTRIMLVDDEVAGSSWEQDLYRMAVTPEIDHRFRQRRGRGRPLPGGRTIPPHGAAHRRPRHHGGPVSSRSGRGAPDQPGGRAPSRRAGGSGCPFST